MSDLRLLTAGVALGLTTFGFGLAPAQAQAAKELTVVSWGGAYTKSQVKAYHKPFEKQTGVKILSEDYNGGLAQIKAQVEAGNVTWDLVDLELSDVVRGCDEGLLEQLDLDDLPPAPDGTPAKEDFLPGTLQDCAVVDHRLVDGLRLRLRPSSRTTSRRPSPTSSTPRSSPASAACARTPRSTSSSR